MANKIKKAVVALCVECDSRVYFRAQPSLGERITCRECGTKLEVVDLDPLELYWIDDFDRGSDDDPYADYNNAEAIDAYDSDNASDAYDY